MDFDEINRIRQQLDDARRAQETLDLLKQNQIDDKFLRELKEARKFQDLIDNIPEISYLEIEPPAPSKPELPKFELRNLAQEQIDSINQRVLDETSLLKDGESLTLYVIAADEKIEVIELIAINNFQIEVKGLLRDSDTVYIVRFDEIKLLLLKTKVNDNEWGEFLQ